MVTFQPLALAERKRLHGVLERNAAGKCGIRMNTFDTSFEGEETALLAVEEDNTVVNAIKSVPCHYGK
jgi:hypothetical protein